MDKKSIKIFVFFFLLGLLIFNWEDVSWVFNYKVISGLYYGFMTPFGEPTAQSLPVPTYNFSQIAPVATVASATPVTTVSDITDVIEIPAISIKTAIVFPDTTDAVAIKPWLDRGAAVFPGSAMPGQIGRTIVLGHSAPPNWPKIKQDWIFSKLNNLNEGDQIFLYYQNKKYTYTIRNKSIIDKNQELPSSDLTNGNNELALISCWPPGSDYKRIAIQAELLVQ